MLLQEGRGSRPPRSVLPAFRSAVLPGGTSRHPLHQVHPGVLELRPDEPEAEEEDPEVVLGACRVVRPLVFGGGAGRGLGFRGDCEAKLNVRLNLSGVGRAVEKPEFNRAHPPHVVEVDVAVAGPVVVRRIRVCIPEPSLVEGRAGGRFRPFEALDEGAVGAPGVVLKAAFQGSGGLEDELLLFVENPRDVGDLAGVEIGDSNVDVLGGALRGLGPGVAQGANHRLQGFEVVPFQNRGDHLGAGGAASKAAVADGFPMPSVRRDHRPLVVTAAGVANRAADHRVDRPRRALAADVGVLKFRPEGQGLRRLNRVGHACLHRLAVDRFVRGGVHTAPVDSAYITIQSVDSQ